MTVFCLDEPSALVLDASKMASKSQSKRLPAPIGRAQTVALGIKER